VSLRSTLTCPTVGADAAVIAVTTRSRGHHPWRVRMTTRVPSPTGPVA